MRRQILAVSALLAAAVPAQAAYLSVGPHMVAVEGPIVAGDAAHFAAFLAQADAGGWQVNTIRLKSPGGYVEEALSIARIIRARGFNTVVTAGGMCASACFLPFAAGKAKTVEEGARVGVHNASRTHGVGPDDEITTAEMADFSREMGVPALVTDRMKVQNSTDMAWLSNAELRAMDVIVVNPDRGNDWALPGQKPDEAASKAITARYNSPLRQEWIKADLEAQARFKANPVHDAIMGANSPY